MSENVVDTLVPAAQTHKVVLGEGTDSEVVFHQRPLSFFGKIEFFSVMGSAIEKALSGGATISEILDIPGAGTSLTSNDLTEADVFVKAISRVVQHAPELLEDVYCISLGVPREDREWAKRILRDNLTDEQGFKILEVFVDQNWEAMMDFFSKQTMPLVAKISQKMQSRSTSSKPSKATRQRTQSA